MRLLIALGLGVGLAACLPDRQAEPPLPRLPHQILETDCRRAGGSLGPVAGGLLACLRDTRDAGKQCSRQGDCEGQCLARSGTCAPVDPLFGCHEVLNPQGVRVTQCRD
jgi:hypothetical protein